MKRLPVPPPDVDAGDLAEALAAAYPGADIAITQVACDALPEPARDVLNRVFLDGTQPAAIADVAARSGRHTWHVRTSLRRALQRLGVQVDRSQPAAPQPPAPFHRRTRPSAAAGAPL